MKNRQLENKSKFLCSEAQNAFQEVLNAIDADNAVSHAVKLSGKNKNLSIKETLNLSIQKSPVYSIALGKAALPMAQALCRILGNDLTGGVISCPVSKMDLPPMWKVFNGGHPLPNEESFLGAEASFELLKKANTPETIVIFLVSGGGSAMMELPKNRKLTLADLQEVNQILVTCGATISEINTIRRLLSRVKGGGLSRAAFKSKQFSLIISDTNSNEVFNVASGPTLKANDLSKAEVQGILERYDLENKLPRFALESIKEQIQKKQQSVDDNSPHFVLLDNQTAIKKATLILRKKGFVVKPDENFTEGQIKEGCAGLMKSLVELRQKTSPEKPVAIISGGEFVCPVKGTGRGGRNSEAALRSAILFEGIKQEDRFSQTSFAALFAGTDGIDGNSPAAGAIADQTTIERAKKLNLNAAEFLQNSDSYSFFSALEDAIITNPTGTNVRDIRMLLAF